MLVSILDAMDTIDGDGRFLLYRVALERLMSDCGIPTVHLGEYVSDMRLQVTTAQTIRDGGGSSHSNAALHGGLPELMGYMEMRRIMVVVVFCIAAGQAWVLQRDPPLHTVHEQSNLPSILAADNRLALAPVLQLMLNYGGDMSGGSSHWQLLC